MQGALWDMARADLKLADLPPAFWGKAVLNASQVILYLPCKRLGGISPIHHITGKPGDVSRFRVFGCPVQLWVAPRNRKHKKVSDRSVQGIHVGQANGSKAWKIYVPTMSPKMQHVDPTDKMLKSTKQFKVVDSDDFIFNETFQDLRGRQMTIHPKGRSPPLEKALDLLFVNADGPLPTSHRQSKRDAQSQPPKPTAASPPNGTTPVKDTPTISKHRRPENGNMGRNRFEPVRSSLPHPRQPQPARHDGHTSISHNSHDPVSR